MPSTTSIHVISSATSPAWDVKGNGWPADFFEWYNLGVIWSHSLEELWIFSHWANSHSLPLETFPHTLAINSLYPIQILHTHYIIVWLYTSIYINYHKFAYSFSIHSSFPAISPYSIPSTVCLAFQNYGTNIVVTYVTCDLGWMGFRWKPNHVTTTPGESGEGPSLLRKSLPSGSPGADLHWRGIPVPFREDLKWLW
jgi:hypothetical protein